MATSALTSIMQDKRNPMDAKDPRTPLLANVDHLAVEVLLSVEVLLAAEQPYSFAASCRS